MSTAPHTQTLTTEMIEDERMIELESALAVLLTEAGLGTLQRHKLASSVKCLLRSALHAGGARPGTNSSAPARCLHQRPGYEHSEAVICLPCYVDTCHAAEAAWRAAREAYQSASVYRTKGAGKDTPSATKLGA